MSPATVESYFRYIAYVLIEQTDTYAKRGTFTVAVVFYWHAEATKADRDRNHDRYRSNSTDS